MNEEIVLTTSVTYPWSFVTQIFRYGCDRKTLIRSDDFN